MLTERVLLLTDVVDSTLLTEELGDPAASALWAEHDRVARDLLAVWSGREIDRSDGFLLLFEHVEQAVGFVMDFHRTMGTLARPLRSRAGIHCSPMFARQNSPEDIALGAKDLELDGIGKAVAARIMNLARGGQTLLSEAACKALQTVRHSWRLQSHGHWRMKGLAEPLELFEVGGDDSPFLPPPDSAKCYRVVRVDGGWAPVAALRHGLPAERDGFVGRGEALKTLAARFDDGARLVSVLGIGGIGKTRLALRYARDWLGSYPGGAWFCDLSSARSLDGIVHAVAQALDVPLSTSDPVRQLGAAIAGRGECLIILDNFEQVARHTEATVGMWMEGARDARFLVTSREVLGIVGEETFSLSPLTSAEAVDLFDKRAFAADSGYHRNAEDQETLVRLVELLDHLPLAIELAAPRVRVMDVSTILGRMSERFKLLAVQGGRRDRQATLRAALDWSWELLSTVEQSALAQLSVFEGGFTLEAAEAVVNVAELPGGPWVADVLQQLVEKSLVRRVSPARFDLLRTVQDYASEHVRSNADGTAGGHADPGALHRRHWEYFAGIADPDSTAERCIDTDNLVLALSRSARAGAWGDAVELLVRCSDVLLLSGPAGAVVTLAQDVVQAPDLTNSQRAAACRSVGNAHYMMGQTNLAHRYFEEGLRHAIDVGDGAQQVRLRCALAEVLIRMGKHGPAQELLDAALLGARALNDPRLEYLALNRLGVMLLEQGEFPGAETHLRRAMQAARQLGHRRWEGGLLGNLGMVLYELGRPDEAAQLFRDSIAIAQSFGDRQWSSNAQSNLAFLLLERGSPLEAQHEFESVLPVAREIGHSTLAATVLCNLGLALLAQSLDQEAALRLAEAAELSNQIGVRRLEAESRRHLAMAFARLGQVDAARTQALAARDIATELGWAREVEASNLMLQGLSSSPTNEAPVSG